MKKQGFCRSPLFSILSNTQDSIGKPVACKPSTTYRPVRSGAKPPKPPKPVQDFPLFPDDSKRSGAFLFETATNEIT